jgi:hypothetical protein
MAMLSPRLALAAALALASLSACARPGDFPSLAPRPIEKALAESEEEPAPQPPADDPQLPARLDAFVQAGRRGQAAFEAALPAARAAVARAGAPGSDSWVEAQQALSRVEAGRAAVAGALSDLNDYAVAQAKARPLGPGDSRRIGEATEALQRIAAAQQREVEALQARLGG